MRVVVSVKPTPGGGQTSQATRYIAYRERDEEREGTEPRPLFSAKEETLSFWRAERVLTADRAPTKDELLHIAVSFHEEDFHSLGGKEADRQQALKEVTREAVDQFKEDLNVDELRWVAGIHRNTDNPHIHLLLHRDSVDRDTGLERRINRLPESALPSRITDETGIEKIEPGSLGRAFELALDRARERELSRVAIREKTPTSDDILVEAARQNPSLAGRQLTTEIILRGPAREPGERPDDTDLRSAFQVRSLDDPDYRTQPEQADWLGARSQTMRDLYERGTMLKGDVLVIPAEDHELPTDRDQPFITSLSYAHERIQNPVQAAEFHTLARTIAGETADPRTEIEVFRHYYDRVRHDAERDRTLDEMRLLADEMAKLETRESIEAAFTVESFPDRANEGRESAFNTAARKVRLDEDSLRLPSGIPFEMKQQLVSRTLPAIDRQLETGRARAEILAAIDGSTYRPELSEFEQDERRRIGQFLKGYVGERLRDPETRALNRSPAFRMAHAQIVEARTPKELNRAAETFLRQNLERSHDPKPDATPLSARERSLLFFGRAPDHHTPEMRDLRHAWGLSRTERAARVQALREGELAPSPTLSEMTTELESRRTLPALRHYQAAMLNDEMRNPSRLNLRQMYERLPPHERTYLFEEIEGKKRLLEPRPTPARGQETDRTFSGISPEINMRHAHEAHNRELPLTNDGGVAPDRNSTVDKPPEDRDRRSWTVDSTREWHFDSLRDLAEPMPIPVADHGIEREHDFSLDR